MTEPDASAYHRCVALAASLPPDIAAGLRRIEQERGYAARRLELADEPARHPTTTT